MQIIAEVIYYLSHIGYSYLPFKYAYFISKGYISEKKSQKKGDDSYSLKWVIYWFKNTYVNWFRTILAYLINSKHLENI